MAQRSTVYGEATHNARFVVFCAAAPCCRSFPFSFGLNSSESPPLTELSPRGRITFAAGEGGRLAGLQQRSLGVCELQAYLCPGVSTVKRRLEASLRCMCVDTTSRGKHWESQGSLPRPCLASEGLPDGLTATSLLLAPGATLELFLHLRWSLLWLMKGYPGLPPSLPPSQGASYQTHSAES